MSEQETLDLRAPSVSSASFLRVGLEVLGTKALRWVVLLLSAAAFVPVMIQPNWLRLVGACVFALLFGLPAFWRKNS